MLSFDTTLLNVYLIGVFSLAGIALVLSLGVATTEVVRYRRRLSRHESATTYVRNPLASPATSTNMRVSTHARRSISPGL
jgi:hypothetical protein